MASSRKLTCLLSCLLLPFLLSSTAQAQVIDVGGARGWTLQQYQPITAHVGQILNFSFGPRFSGEWNDVWRFRSWQAYMDCNFLEASQLCTARSCSVLLSEGGRSYYGCGIDGGVRCQAGQKVAVYVTGEQGPALNPPEGQALEGGSKDKGNQGSSLSKEGWRASSLLTREESEEGVEEGEEEGLESMVGLGAGGGNGGRTPLRMMLQSKQRWSLASNTAAQTHQGAVINVGGLFGWNLPNTFSPITAHVGDKLVFAYLETTPGNYNDVQLFPDLAAYTNCDFSKAQMLKNSTNFTLTLNQTGVFYFGSNGLALDCLQGQKVQVTVLAAGASQNGSALAPSPGLSHSHPPPKGHGSSPPGGAGTSQNGSAMAPSPTSPLKDHGALPPGAVAKEAHPPAQTSALAPGLAHTTPSPSPSPIPSAQPPPPPLHAPANFFCPSPGMLASLFILLTLLLC